MNGSIFLKSSVVVLAFSFLLSSQGAFAEEGQEVIATQVSEETQVAVALQEGQEVAVAQGSEESQVAAAKSASTNNASPSGDCNSCAKPACPCPEKPACPCPEKPKCKSKCCPKKCDTKCNSCSSGNGTVTARKGAARAVVEGD